MKNFKKFSEAVQTAAKRLPDAQERAYFYDIVFGLRPCTNDKMSEVLAEQLNDDLVYLIERAEAVKRNYIKKTRG